jgi:PBSX family phage terminase large subunit
VSTLVSTSKKSEPEPRVIRYRPYGQARDLFTRHNPELVICGPAGTGKSRACLEKLHLCAAKYPGARILMLRKSLASLKTSGLVTFDSQVRPHLDGVIFRGETAKRSPEYRYSNGSVIIIGGMDKPGKVMSAEYDLIYVQEATELREEEWEALTTRLRNGKMPYQQLLADCNPDGPTHWLKRRADAGKITLLESRHEDNPTITAAYLAKLDALTGVRYLRLRKGLWAAAEGIVYEGWDRALHLIPRFPIPADWPRYWSVDFGYTNPFVWHAWARDHDGRLFCYREIYRTQRLVEDHCRTIKQVTQGEPLPRAILCDHDAEDRATMEAHLEMSTQPATKTISPGIQAVQSRLRLAGDGKPRLYFLQDSLVERDPALVDAHKPGSTVEEFESYIWDVSNGRKHGEVPVDKHNHGMDAMRYQVAYHDLEPRGMERIPSIRG